VKPTLSLRTVNLGLVVLLILVMCSQLGFQVPLGRAALPVTIADVVLALAVIGVALSLLSRKLRGIRLPPIQAFVLVAIALIAVARAPGGKLGAAKEALQLIEYFLVAFFVFVNVAETRDLKLYLAAFAIATAAVVAWAAIHYVVCDSPFRIRAGYANRNGLGAFLAISLPMLYGLALHARRWLWRILLLLVVACGLFVTLAGGALLVTLVVLGILSALRGQRALLPYAVFLCFALTVGPHLLARRHHADALHSSVAVTVDDNFLLSDLAMVDRARELLRPTRKIPTDPSAGEAILPAPRPLDARRLLNLLANRGSLRGDHPVYRESLKLFVEVERTIDSSITPQQLASYPLDTPQLAVRYQRWGAAVACARTFGGSARGALLGMGMLPYHEALKPFMSQRLQYRTDEPDVYNVAAPEPMTHNLWLKTLVLTGVLGLLALAWLVATFLHRAHLLYRRAHSELALGTALGTIGSILGFSLAGLFTETVARGLTIPFVFVLAAAAVAERIVRGDGRTALEQLTRYD